MSHRLEQAQLEEIASSTIGHYDRYAERFWEGTKDHDVSQNRDALLRHLQGTPPQTILDLGCGPGRDLLVFKLASKNLPPIRPVPTSNIAPASSSFRRPSGTNRGFLTHPQEAGFTVVGLDGSQKFCEAARTFSGCEVWQQVGPLPTRARALLVVTWPQQTRETNASTR
eukprot:7198711-Pyramimonas_sp.AAC.1